jgi:hypothetical protein
MECLFAIGAMNLGALTRITFSLGHPRKTCWIWWLKEGSRWVKGMAGQN